MAALVAVARTGLMAASVGCSSTAVGGAGAVLCIVVDLVVNLKRVQTLKWPLECRRPSVPVGHT